MIDFRLKWQYFLYRKIAFRAGKEVLLCNVLYHFSHSWQAVSSEWSWCALCKWREKATGKRKNKRNADCRINGIVIYFDTWETREPGGYPLFWTEGQPSRRKKGGRCLCVLHILIWFRLEYLSAPLWDCVTRSFRGNENSRHYCNSDGLT